MANLANYETYLGGHGGESNIILGYEVYDIFYIQFEDSVFGMDSSWRMNMTREQAEKICKKMMEWLGMTPIEEDFENERKDHN